METSNTFVLSIQSHVVREYVGNKAAVFPLQRMGLNVDFINTVQFSSMFVHLGNVLQEEVMEQLLTGLLSAYIIPKASGYPGSLPLDLNEIISYLVPSIPYSLELAAHFIGSPYSLILTGYIANSQSLSTTISFIKGLKTYNTNNNIKYKTSNKDNSDQKNFLKPYTNKQNGISSEEINKNIIFPSLSVPSELSNIKIDEFSKILEILEQKKKSNLIPLWLCDPVFGDNGVFYVGMEVVKIYKEYALPLADMITPNQFEAEVLSDTHIHDFKDAINTIKLLHINGPKHIIITSIFFQFDQKHLYAFCSTHNQNKRANNFIVDSTSICKDKYNLNNNGLKDKFSDEEFNIYFIRFPKRDIYLGGTGDLFAALVGANYLYMSLPEAFEKSISIVQEVITNTLKKNKEAVSLDVVSGQAFYENCPISFKAQSISLLPNIIFDN